MTEQQVKTSQALNEFRRLCRKSKISFKSKDFRKAAAFGGLSISYLKVVLRALVERGFVQQEGTRLWAKYTWKPLYKNENKLEEYDAINPNSWDLIFKRAKEIQNGFKKASTKAVAPTLTVAVAIDFLKKSCPNIRITETFTCADGSTLQKEY